MRTLVHIPTGLSTPELEIMLSCAQEAMDAGHETTVVTCAGGKGYACSVNIYGLRPICHSCKQMTARGVEALTGNYTHLETPPHIVLEPMNAQREYMLSDRWEIKKHIFEGADVGQAAYSSYIAISRDQDIEGRLAQISLNQLLSTSERLAMWFRDVLRARQIDKAVLYNGRQNQYRSLLRVAQQEKIAIEVMEFFGHSAENVYSFVDDLPQDLAVLEQAINDCWESFTGDIGKAAESFYILKRGGGAANDSRSHVLGQTRGLLPEGLDATKHNIAIFNSSEDEYAAVGGEYDKTLYVNQTDAMQRLGEALQDDPNVVLWLRMHPNLATVHWSFAEKLRLVGKQFTNVRVIPAASPVSSYDLLAACDTVVSFGSTMGIEAVYWGKPSILLGRCVYERFGSVYAPRTHEEALGLIRTRNLSQLPIEGALKIGVFWMRGGHAISHFSGTRTQGFRFHKQLFQKTRWEQGLYSIAKAIEKVLLGQCINYGLGKTRQVMKEYLLHAPINR